MIELGPFRIGARVGTGAMGQVYDGLHGRTGTPVAIKFVLAPSGTSAVAVTSVRREARAIAALRHPHVVAIHDTGEVPQTVAAALGVAVGSPYIVMERLSGGTLDERHGKPAWPALLRDLKSILGALSHCHARGVLHRDLKPSNLLFGRASDPRPGLKLVDFGISWSDGGIETAASFGTPEFCAPEQQGNEPHAQGPWTDIYAVGTIAWKLTTGNLPFGDKRGMPLYMAKTIGELPPYHPVIDVPDGFEDWLCACLAGPPGDRFQCGPDALFHLDNLDANGATTVVRAWKIGDIHPPDLPDPNSLPARSLGAPEPAPLRSDPLEVPLPPPSLQDAGLALWEVRPPPMTGRLAQRVRLWQRLEQTAEDGQTRLLLLRGPPGSGRTRVGRWLLETALESGGVGAVQASGAATGLEGLLRQLLKVPENAAEEQLGNALWVLEHHGVDDADVVEKVTAWLRKPEVGEVRVAATVAVLHALAARRPWVIFFDDADRDPELAEAAEALLALPPRALVVVLAGADPVDVPAEEVPTLDPMRRRTLTRLLAGTLPLGPDGLRHTVEGASGRPGLAMRLLHQASRDGRFRFTPHGIELDEGEPAALPPLPPSTRGWLERAALLGVFPRAPMVDRSFRNVKAARAAGDDAVARGLVRRDGDVIRFAPGVRLALQRVAQNTIRHHQALGKVLPPESPDGALHRVLGGDVGGYTQLVEAIDLMDRGIGLVHRLAYCERGLALWEDSGMAPSAGAWSELVIRRVDMQLALERPLDGLEQYVENATAHDVDDALARLLVARAHQAANPSKDLHHALTLADDPRIRAETFLALAAHAQRSEDLPLMRYWLACCGSFADSEDRRAAGEGFAALGTLAAMDGLWADASLAFDEAVRRALSPGEREVQAALCALVAGDLVRARSGLVQGAYWATLRRDRQLLPRAVVRLALLEALEGHIGEAEARLADADRLLSESRDQYRPDPSFAADVRALVALERKHWRAAQRHLVNMEPVAWPRPGRVAILQRVAALLPEVPEPLRGDLATEIEGVAALREQWA